MFSEICLLISEILYYFAFVFENEHAVKVGNFLNKEIWKQNF
jgi:hypothetical protein